ncbi:unnamed protein product, partial [Scytosiphon promiscuus]
IYRKEEKESKNEIFGSEDGAHDRIYVLSESEEPLSNVIHADSPPLEIFPGEEAEYLSEFTRVVGGDVTLDRRRHTAKVQVFAGARATVTQGCDALLDTGSPASFIQQRSVQREVRRRVVSARTAG